MDILASTTVYLTSDYAIDYTMTHVVSTLNPMHE